MSVHKQFIICLVLALFLTACGGQATPTTDSPPDPQTMLLEVVQNLREVNTFRILIEQTGAEYRFTITPDAGTTYIEASLRRAEGQFLAPDIISANVNLNINNIPLSMVLFAQGPDQWFRLPTSPWFNFPFAEDFDASALIREDSGFQKALLELKSLEYVEATRLDDGTAVHHMRGIAGAQSVNDLLFGLLTVTDDVIVDVFVDRANQLPALLIVTQPGTETEQEPEPTQWRVEIYDVNAEANIEYPEGWTNGS